MEEILLSAGGYMGETWEKKEITEMEDVWGGSKKKNVYFVVLPLTIIK